MADHGEENTVLTLMLRGVDLDRPQRQQPRLGQPQIDSGVVEVFIAQVTPHSPPVIDRSTFKPKITTAETYSERQSLQELAEAHRPFSTDELVVVVDRLREIECFGSPEAFYQATQEMVGDNPQATFQLGNSEVQVISFTNKRGEQYAQVSVLQSREASRQVNEVFNRRQPENLRVFEYILHENTLVVREGEGRPNKMEYQERAYNSADDRVLWPVLRRIQNPGPEDRQISPDGKG
jgi:hypothetical protein